MSNLDLVRAEIKSWERDFASKHGRDPSVQDIKDQPAIAERYKLYKKLSKSLPKTRTPGLVPPLPGFNPFSPAKKTAARQTSPRPNPFATPAKSIPKPRPQTPLDSPLPNATASHALPAPSTAISRARKRLRGEPVSPSPSKPKRQRIHSQALPSLPKSEQDSSNSESDQELPLCDFSSSFVADSPVKAPAGGKSFKLLFDDALPALPIPRKLVGSSIPRPGSPSNAASAALPAFRRPHYDLASRNVISGTLRGTGTQNSIFPAKDNLSVPSHRSSSTVDSGVSHPRASTKRALDSDDPPRESTEPSALLQSKYSLIPPSPPEDSISRDTAKEKKKIASRKRLRVEGEDSDDGLGSPEGVTPKVSTVGLRRDKCFHRQADDLDWDPLLHLGTRNQDDANHNASGTFTVDLPEKFRCVLAISPSRSQNRTEERVVRGLLYGDRVGHYDPSRGGVIWDAGEVDDTAYGDAETEDDWEGEPVPWEVGEL